MPIHHRHNVYKGVNAHLHSLFQGTENWDGFHGRFIEKLAEYLDGILPDNYIVDTERSLQLKEYHANSGVRIRLPKPDVLIFRSRPPEQPLVAAPAEVVEALTIPIPATFEPDSEAQYAGLVIVESTPEAPFGRVVTRIELLSPSNKTGEKLKIYREKRYFALHTNTALVEIDLLHEAPSPVRGIPHYPRNPDSFPYAVIVSDPTPHARSGKAVVYRFSVDMPLPQFDLPLGSGDHITVDLDPVYQSAFNGRRAYGLLVDYEQRPERFKRYSAADQERIRAVMQRAAQLAAQP
jgi:hypothetical protein